MPYNVIDDVVWYKYNEYTSKYYKCFTTHAVSMFEFNNDYLAPLRFEYDWQVHIDDSVPDRIVAEVYLKRK